ncbi:MAG TPA: chemotaxis protein CheW [Gammaproteobacteria bacterium]
MSAVTEEKELYSLLIPLEGERLLVPRMCVAEVIAFAETERDREREFPDWFLGTLDWNGRRLPVVSFAVARTEEPRKRSRTRVVVFHAITNELKGGYYGLLTQGFPQLVRVNRDVLGLDRELPLPEGLPAICRARMIHEYPLIPDVERIERMLAEIGYDA